jgi:hypothetical protein
VADRSAYTELRYQRSKPSSDHSLTLFSWWPNARQVGQHAFREFGHVPNMSLALSVLRPWTWPFDPYEASSYYLFVCAIYVQTACLCILLLIRFGVIVANVIDKPSAALAKPFDFFAMANGDSTIDRLVDRLYSRSFRYVGFVLWIFAWFTVSQP